MEAASQVCGGPRQRLRLTQCHGAARAALQSAERWEVVVRQWNNKVVVWKTCFFFFCFVPVTGNSNQLHASSEQK